MIKIRATNLEQFQEMSNAFIASLKAQAIPLNIQPDDVIIAPYSKCGTTWLQQIFHTLRTGGDTDYDDISRVVPWIDTSPGLGLDINGPQKAEPRGFKSHARWENIPKGGRYIVSIRDPKDALVSFYKFMEGWIFEPGTIALEDFALKFYIHRPAVASYWAHLISWWEQRDNPNVLLLSYEGMKNDHQGTIRKVADFCGIELTDNLLEITKTNSSLAFMLEHKDKFADKLMRQYSEKFLSLPAGSDSAKVREGKVGGHKQHLSDQIIDALDRHWQTEITARFGFSSYEEMEALCRQ